MKLTCHGALRANRVECCVWGQHGRRDRWTTDSGPPRAEIWARISAKAAGHRVPRGPGRCPRVSGTAWEVTQGGGGTPRGRAGARGSLGRPGRVRVGGLSGASWASILRPGSYLGREQKHRYIVHHLKSICDRINQ